MEKFCNKSFVNKSKRRAYSIEFKTEVIKFAKLLRFVRVVFIACRWIFLLCFLLSVKKHCPLRLLLLFFLINSCGFYSRAVSIQGNTVLPFFRAHFCFLSKAKVVEIRNKDF